MFAYTPPGDKENISFMSDPTFPEYLKSTESMRVSQSQDLALADTLHTLFDESEKK